jgi:hypothetical protein
MASMKWEDDTLETSDASHEGNVHNRRDVRTAGEACEKKESITPQGNFAHAFTISEI